MSQAQAHPTSRKGSCYGILGRQIARPDLTGVHRLEDRIQEAVAEPAAGQHSCVQGFEPYG